MLSIDAAPTDVDQTLKTPITFTNEKEDFFHDTPSPEALQKAVGKKLLAISFKIPIPITSQKDLDATLNDTYTGRSLPVATTEETYHLLRFENGVLIEITDTQKPPETP